METHWRRTHESLGVGAALDAVDGGALWAILWCGGKVSRSTKGGEDDLAYARANVIEPEEREKLYRKAVRKGRTKTVIMAERWEDGAGGPLVVFYETGPYLLPDRDDPFDPRAVR